LSCTEKIASDYSHADIFTPECRFLLWACTTAASHGKFQTGRATNNITSRSRKSGTEKNSQHIQQALGSLGWQDDGAMREAGSGSGETKDANGMTALLRAASDNNRREAVTLILSGADPSVADGQGLTALHYAEYDGRVEFA
jgi:ankyrin repeat protein